MTLIASDGVQPSLVYVTIALKWGENNWLNNIGGDITTGGRVRLDPLRLFGVGSLVCRRGFTFSWSLVPGGFVGSRSSRPRVLWCLFPGLWWRWMTSLCCRIRRGVGRVLWFRVRCMLFRSALACSSLIWTGFCVRCRLCRRGLGVCCPLAAVVFRGVFFRGTSQLEILGVGFISFRLLLRRLTAKRLPGLARSPTRARILNSKLDVKLTC